MIKKLFPLLFLTVLTSCNCQSGQESSVPTENVLCDTLTDWKPMEDSLFAKETSKPAADFVLLADVCPDIIQEIRYYSTFNFVGRRIPGYSRPIAYLTRQAAESLKAVSDDLVSRGYRLKIFDGYRPQQAVDYFIKWARDVKDQSMKPYFYPDCPKSELFSRGYLAHKSGHSRGSTVDVTLFDMTTEREVDMGSTYDMLGEASHFNYSKGLTKEQIANRRLLREVMSRHGFKPISNEWWHFTLRNEPHPNTYFNFEIK